MRCPSCKEEIGEPAGSRCPLCNFDIRGEARAAEAEDEPAEAETVIDFAAPPVSETADPDADLKQLLSELGRRAHKTIAVVGSYEVGKTVFISAATQELEARFGLKHKAVEINPQKRRNEAGEKAVQPKVMNRTKLDADRPFEITRHIVVHNYRNDATQEHIRIIDIPGEYFFAAMDEEDGLDATGFKQIQLLHPVCAAAEGFILLIPANQVFPPPGGSQKREKEVSEAPALLQEMSSICSVMDHLGGRDDFEQAVTRMLALSRDERDNLKHKLTGRCERPAMVLLSQADRCFGIGAGRAATTIEDDVCESDPYFSVAGKEPQLIARVNASFKRHRIDFLTAYEGAHLDPLPEVRVGFGVWPSLKWMFDAIRPAPAKKAGRLTGWWERWKEDVMARHDLSDHQDGWVLDMRKDGDPGFRQRLPGA